jgi:hypothetical protein
VKTNKWKFYSIIIAICLVVYAHTTVRICRDWGFHWHSSIKYNLWVGVRKFEQIQWDDPYYFEIDENTLLFEDPEGLVVVIRKPYRVVRFAERMATNNVEYPKLSVISKSDSGCVLQLKDCGGQKLLYRLNYADGYSQVSLPTTPFPFYQLPEIIEK